MTTEHDGGRFPRRSLHIRILMGTHNGARYLDEQLASFLAQSHHNWSLWVSDDGSTDDTPELLAAFRDAHPDREIRLLRGPERDGTENFLRLLAHPGPEGGLLALSDQDDVWRPDKLARAAEAMAGMAGSLQPAAYGAGWWVTDEALRVRHRSRPAPRGPSFGNALVQNIFSGHSLVLNGAARALVAAAGRPHGVRFHDWWIYLLISGAGGRLIRDDAPVLYYRQHAENTVGTNFGLLPRLRRLSQLFGRDFARWVHANAHALAGMEEILTPENRRFLRGFLAADGARGLSRLRALRALGIRRQARLETLALMAAAALGNL